MLLDVTPHSYFLLIQYSSTLAPKGYFLFVLCALVQEMAILSQFLLALTGLYVLSPSHDSE
jgi:hypothetical protein